MKRIAATLILAALLLMPMAAIAERPPITWLSFSKAKHNQGMAATGVLVQQMSPVFDKLVAEGHATSWGIAVPIVHGPGQDWSHMTWVTVADWGGISAMDKAFAAHFQSMTPEQSKANQEQWDAVIEPGSHYDTLLNQEVFWVNPEAELRYFGVGYWQARPGEGQAMSEMYKKMVQPIYQKLADDGVIGAYGMGTQELHNQHSTSHTDWVIMDDLAKVDTVNAAFQEAFAADPQGWAGIMELSDMSTHTDTVLMVVHPRPGGGGEGE